MITLFDDPAVLHHEDHVGAADRRQPVGDHETRPIRPQRVHGFLDEHLGAGVDRAGRLVEDQDRRIAEERPGDRHQLLLAGRDVAALVVDDRVVPVGEGAHESIHVRDPGGLVDLLVGGIRIAVPQVVADRAAEQPGVLQHHADVGAELVAREAGDVTPVEGDPTRVELVEPHDEVHERRLARTGRADDGDGLAPARRPRSAR